MKKCRCNDVMKIESLCRTTCLDLHTRGYEYSKALKCSLNLTEKYAHTACIYPTCKKGKILCFKLKISASEVKANDLHSNFSSLHSKIYFSIGIDFFVLFFQKK